MATLTLPRRQLTLRDKLNTLVGEKVAVDTETTGVNVWQGDCPFAVSFCDSEGNTCYVEWPVDPFTRQVLWNHDDIAALREFLEDVSRTYIFYNAKFDVRMLQQNFDIYVPHEKVRDVMFMAHCCNTLEINYKLKRLAKVYLDFPDNDEKALLDLVKRLRRHAPKLGWQVAFEMHTKWDGTIKKKAAIPADYWLPRAALLSQEMRDLLEKKSPELLIACRNACEKYAVGDAERTMLLHEFYEIGLTDLKAWKSFELEMALWSTIYRFEERGVYVNREVCQHEHDNCMEHIKEHWPKVQEVAGLTFNPDSRPQLRRFLYDECKLPVLAWTKTGLPSTSFGQKAAKGMLDFAQQHPAIFSLVKVMGSAKAINSFFGKYLKLMIPDEHSDGYALHPDLQQRGPATTRTSCKMPNIQNVPGIGTTLSAEPIYARKPFGPRPGYKWLLIDYDNMEMRIFAAMAKERIMLEAFKHGQDVHGSVTNTVWGGKGNLHGLDETRHVLEINGYGNHDEIIRKVWKELGVNPDKVGHYSIEDQRKIADIYLQRFDYDIVKSQKYIGKKNTRVKAKMLSFTNIYGGGDGAVARQMQVEKHVAKELRQEYYRRFPDIGAYMTLQMENALRDGCVYTCFGDRLTVHPDFAYRAVNYIIQGSAAQLLKRAMLRCDRHYRNNDLEAYVMMPIHDEIVFEVADAYCTIPFILKTCSLMEETDGALDIHMKVAPSLTSTTWEAKEELELSTGRKHG